jgi:hypothetical protein
LVFDEVDRSAVSCDSLGGVDGGAVNSLGGVDGGGDFGEFLNDAAVDGGGDFGEFLKDAAVDGSISGTVVAFGLT